MLLKLFIMFVLVFRDCNPWVVRTCFPVAISLALAS